MLRVGGTAKAGYDARRPVPTGATAFPTDVFAALSDDTVPEGWGSAWRRTRVVSGSSTSSSRSLARLSTFYDNAEIDYGLGLINPADGYAQGVGHMGANFGYNSWSACLTEDHLIVVVLTNWNADIFNLARPLVTAARSE